jgi:hypothetical protein
MLELIANAGPDPLDKILPWVTTFVVAVIGAVAGISLKLEAKRARREGVEEGKSQSMQITNQPLQVKLEEHFVTRREFDKLEATIGRDVMEMKGLFERTMQRIEIQSSNLTTKIEKQGERLGEQIAGVAKTAYEGRKGIHQKINEQGEQISALRENADVAKEIGKLASAIRKQV